jgi:CheY-like chemotaxis protein
LDFNKINVTTRFDPDLPEIPCDPDQMIEVLLNIIDNAQQAMTEARGGGELEINAHRIEDRIRISVTDNGLGIPGDNLDQIFLPFFTTKDVGKGTGLGLSISLGIVQKHGGRLWAESAPGEGSTFHLELPVDPSSPVVGVDAAATTPGPAADGGMSRRILVVNDELGFRQLLSRALAPDGNLIDLASHWTEAWNLVQRNSYDRIILNLGLPAVNGLQLYERIRAYDSSLAAKCIFITGYLLTPELETTLAATGVPYLTKPFAVAQIRGLALPSAESRGSPDR